MNTLLTPKTFQTDKKLSPIKIRHSWRCGSCLRPPTQCYCSSISRVSLPPQIHITYFCHKRERFLSSNSLKICPLSLPLEQQTFFEIGQPPNEQHFQTWDKYSDLQENSTHLWLFPDCEACDLEKWCQDQCSSTNIHLFIPDGSWHQAKKMKSRLGIQAKSVQLNSATPKSLYQLRKQHRPEGMSTYEALSFSLFYLCQLFEDSTLSHQRLQIMLEHKDIHTKAQGRPYL